jgi:hypothetical protein
MIYYSLHSNDAFVYLLKDIVSYSNYVVVESNIFESVISNTVSLVRDTKMKFQFVEISAKSGKFDLVSNRTQNIVYLESIKLAKFQLPAYKPITTFWLGNGRVATKAFTWYNKDGIAKGINQLFNIRVVAFSISSNKPTITFWLGNGRVATKAIEWYNEDGIAKGINQLFNIRVVTFRICSNIPTISRYPDPSTVLIGETFGDKSEITGTVINNDINSDFYLRIFI